MRRDFWGVLNPSDRSVAARLLVFTAPTVARLLVFKATTELGRRLGLGSAAWTQRVMDTGLVCHRNTVVTVQLS